MIECCMEYICSTLFQCYYTNAHYTGTTIICMLSAVALEFGFITSAWLHYYDHACMLTFSQPHK